MNTQSWNRILGGALALFVGATFPLSAQQRGGGGSGGGGFGGFGGFSGGGGGNNANRSTASTSGSYNNNGAVGSATITVDPDTHNIVFSTDDETADQIRQVLKNLDRPKSQVLIKVVFLEVQHNNSTDIGIEGNYTGQNKYFSALTGFVTNYGVVNNQVVPTSITPINSSSVVNQNFGLTPAASPSSLYQIMGADFQATLYAIAKVGKAELLSRPSILARDGQPATIVVGQSVPLVNGVTYAASGNTTIPVYNIQYTDVGIILKVTPYVSSEGLVEMILQPSTTQVSATQGQTISAGVVVPYLDIRTADTVVVTPDQQTVVIGGLMGAGKSEAVSKVPWLGDLPLIGALFRHKITSSLKTELIIFLTPHIVQAPGQLAALGTQEQNHMLVPKSYSEEELNRFLETVPVKKQ
jgi:type II secretory pathway component GspD/PulD (secretin)